MSIAEFVARLGNVIKDIESDREANATKIVLDSLALVKRRVINTGKDETGKEFGKYSTALVPFWYYYGKETNRNNKTAVAELYRRKGYLASYKDWREVNNLPTAFINFSFTNKMWNSLTPVIVVTRESRTVIGVEASSAKEQDKLNFQNARFGDILALNKQERELVTLANNARILQAFEKNGLI